MGTGINRREFLAAGVAAGAAASPLCAWANVASPTASAGRFGLRFAPHFGTFRHHAGDDPIDQIKFMADAGFAAVEDIGLLRRPPSTLEKIRKELDRHRMTPGLFVASADYGNPTFGSGRDDLRRQVLRDMQQAVDVSRRLGAPWCVIVAGKLDPRIPLEVQHAHAIDTLRRCIDLAEGAGLTILLEATDHCTLRPRMLVHNLERASALCRAVSSPQCRVLFDVYQQQAAGHDPLEALSRAGDNVGYIQVGDFPGRKEPGTGTIDFHRLFAWLKHCGYQGLVGMEHGNSLPGKGGEVALCEAYATYDPR
jgi:hydroxypyruvate isomerase